MLLEQWIHLDSALFGSKRGFFPLVSDRGFSMFKTPFAVLYTLFCWVKVVPFTPFLCINVSCSPSSHMLPLYVVSQRSFCNSDVAKPHGRPPLRSRMTSTFHTNGIVLTAEHTIYLIFYRQIFSILACNLEFRFGVWLCKDQSHKLPPIPLNKKCSQFE